MTSAERLHYWILKYKFSNGQLPTPKEILKQLKIAIVNREIKTDLKDILSLITCARDYGFEDDVLFDAFREMLGGELTEGEIEWHARLVESEDGYTEEDYEAIKERLGDFKKKYCS